MEQLALVLVLAVLVGVTLGLLGGGGSILTVPLLVYVADVDPKQAIAMSLLVVGTTALAGTIGHARAGRVRWRTAGLFGAGGMAGAYLGGRLGTLLPGEVLLGAFAVMMVVTAGAMLRRGRRQLKSHGPRPIPVVVGEGAVVGLVTGIVGAGGGFLVVPALVVLGGLPMHAAVGTSLAVIALKSSAGLAGYLADVSLDWGLAGLVTAATVVGALLGARFAGRIDAERLRRVFGWFVLVTGAGVLLEQLPAGLRSSPLTWVVVVLALGAVGVLVRRRSATSAADHEDGDDVDGDGRSSSADRARTA